MHILSLYTYMMFYIIYIFFRLYIVDILENKVNNMSQNSKG